MRRNTIADFYARTRREGDCLIWTGGRSSDGYGYFWFRNRQWRAHRFAWVVVHGPIPAGLDALHHCDNPPCASLDHLRLGTALDNARDREAKGRGNLAARNTARGNRNGRAKLTPDVVREIRRLIPTVSERAIARTLGISRGPVQQVKRGTTWSHVT